MPVAGTGLTQLGSRDVCSKLVLSYICVTAGRGDTEVTLDNESFPTPLRFPHSMYEHGANVNQSSLDGDVTAGNLSRSQTEECFDELANSTSYCYTTVIRIRLTDQTWCKTIGCRTRFFIDGEDKLTEFGNATIARGK